MSILFYRLNFFLVLFVILITITGCATQSIGTRGWAVSSYPQVCTSGFIPSGPFCLITKIQYKDQFQACRRSILNFTNALDQYYRCKEEKLKSIFDKLLVSVPAKYNCYIEGNDKKYGETHKAFIYRLY